MVAKSKLKFLTCLLAVVGWFGNAEARTIHVAVPTLSMVVIAFTAVWLSELLMKKPSMG